MEERDRDSDDVTNTLTPVRDKDQRRGEAIPRQVVSNQSDDDAVGERDSAAFATPYHEQEFLSPPAGDLIRSYSPAETGSFHTADSPDSSAHGDLDDTEVEMEESIDTMALLAGQGKKPSSSTSHSVPSHPPQPQVFDLPAGYEDQPKLAMRDDSVRPLSEKEPIPMDSRSYHTPVQSLRPQRKDPTKVKLKETTPLLQPGNSDNQQGDASSSSSPCNCCAII